MGKKNNSYTASYKLKVISFAEQFGNRAAQRGFGILESNVRYWRKQKEWLKNAKSDSRAFHGPKALSDHEMVHEVRMFYAPRFVSGQTRKKSAQITRVNTVYCNTVYYNMVYCNTVYCNTVYCNTVYCNTVYCNTVYCNTVYCNTVYCNTVYCNTVYCNTVYCNTVYCNTVYCNTMHGTMNLKCSNIWKINVVCDCVPCLFFLKVFISLTVHINKQRFLTPIESCGLRSCHELAIRTIMVTKYYTKKKHCCGWLGDDAPCLLHRWMTWGIVKTLTTFGFTSVRRSWVVKHLDARDSMQECRGVRRRGFVTDCTKACRYTCLSADLVCEVAHSSRLEEQRRSWRNPLAGLCEQREGPRNVASGILGLKFGNQNETRAC
jgi:hypothetical protein